MTFPRFAALQAAQYAAGLAALHGVAEDVGNGLAKSIFGRRGGQGEGVQNPAHAALQGLVDHLVLLHAGLARELLGNHVGGVVIAVARPGP